MKKLKSIVKKQDGVAMVLVALCLFIFVGFTAIVVDAGGLYFEKSRLQKAVDAAVLGGAQEFNESKDENKAKEVAVNLALKNNPTLQDNFTVDEVIIVGNSIEIHKTVNKDLTFARVLGFDYAKVAALARAEVPNLKSGEGIIPVAMEKDDFIRGKEYTMHFETENGDNTSIRGNFGFLAIGGNGANVLRDGIKNGARREINEEFEWTETGIKWGPVSSGFQYRIDQDIGKAHCQQYDTADNSCSRIVTIPIVETFEYVKGKSEVRIVGFAAFWIESVSGPSEDKEVKGRFIDEFEREGEFGGGSGDFGISGGVILVK